MVRTLIGALALTCLATLDAAAQQYPGQWNCQLANQTASNNAFENYMYQFALAIHQNGSFEAQGQYYAQTNGFNMPFQARGNWQAQQNQIMLQGQEQRQGYNGPFMMVLTWYGPGNMSYRMSTANGNLAMACQQ